MSGEPVGRVIPERALGPESARRFRNGIDVECSRDVAGRPTARTTFRRSLGAAMGAFAAAMLASTAPSFAAGQPPREEFEARTYQWRGGDQISAIVDAASGPKFYDHDRRGRLIRERRPDAVVERAMDAVGNVYRSAVTDQLRRDDIAFGPGHRGGAVVSRARP